MRAGRPFARLVRVACLLAAVAACGPAEQQGGIPKPVPAPEGTPIGQPATQTMGAGGGTLASPDGVLTLTVPAGAVAVGTEFAIQPVTNTAPGGVGGSYLLGPEGTSFSTPVTLAFRLAGTGRTVDGLTVGYQDGRGYWFRAAGVVRDVAAQTLTVTTNHFSSWALVPSDPVRDLAGSFTYQSTLAEAGPPFTATGSAILNFVGEDSYEVAYLAGGALTLPASLPWGTATCVPDSATAQLDANVAESVKSPPKFLWGIAARWGLGCTGPSGASRSLAFTAFDTAGISLLRCSRGYLSQPLIGPDRLQGSYRIDCGAEGYTTATWDFRAASCDQPCDSPNPCHTAIVSCATGTAQCVDTGNVADGTSCGTNLVCGGGVCNACTVGAQCFTQPDLLCHDGTTECGTGFPVCVNGAARPDGSGCGTNLVCGGGVCNACTVGAPCFTQPDLLCHDGTTECGTGFPVCANGAARPNGTSCGTNLVCNGGNCVACSAGQSCTGQPDALCHVGTTDCSTGTSVCVNGTALPDGTGCGTDQVCNGGACATCAANQPCGTNPDTLCHLGTTDCSTGTSACVNGAARPNGTSCGTDQVCNGGACVGCAANQACATNPDTLCHLGTTDCSTGTSVCVNGAARPNGTGCGTDQVCNGGACVACAANQSCTTNPDTLCHLGTTDCSTGTSACVNGAARPNGTGCGTDQVCNGGACVACAANQACATNPDTLCHLGTTECSTGTSVCVNGAARPNGTGCGTDQVCNGGACVACAANQSCTTNPDTLCHLGTTDCSTGTSACVNGAARPNGTGCGTDQVCNGGACVTCAANQACATNPDTLCHLGTTDCATGTSVCVNGAARPNGTSCGTDQVCNGGACVTCAAGQSCTGQPDPLCHAGATDCSTGTSVCVNGAALPDGTSCGAGLTCNAGTCLSSRTVTATRRVTHWPDPPAAQVTVAAPDVATATVEALFPDGGGGWVHYPATPAPFDAGGSASVANVPAGSYLLVFRDGSGVSHVVPTSASAVDLGYDLLGRADVAPASPSTQVLLTLGGLSAAASQVQLTSSNADLRAVAPAVAGPTPLDWAGLSLLAAGDPLYVHDLSAVACGAYSCLVATGWSSQIASGMTDGVQNAIAATLAAATSGSLTVDWRTSAFELLLPDMSPAATTDATAHSLLVGASAHPLANPAPVAYGGTPTLFLLQQPAGNPLGTVDVSAGAVPYGQFLDALWNEWRGVDFSARVSYLAPSATTALVETVSMGRRDPMVPAPATPIAPTLGPVRAPLLGAQSAFSDLAGVGLTPTFSWSPPALGTPTSYAVDVYRLHASGTATASTLVSSLVVAATSTGVALPPGLLQAGNVYYARITARAASPDPFDAAPFRTSNVWTYAQVLTGTFSP